MTEKNYACVTDREAAMGNGVPPFPTFRPAYLSNTLAGIFGGHTPLKC